MRASRTLFVTALLLVACNCASDELALVASQQEPLQLWRWASESAAEVVVKELKARTQSDIKVNEVDLSSLKIWTGQRLELALELEGLRYKFVTDSSSGPGAERQWASLADALPTSQGGLLSQGNWPALDRQWVRPLVHGSALPDLTVEGPLDLFLSTPAAVPLFLPHASDAGRIARVLLREAHAPPPRPRPAHRLRRPVDLPPLGLSEFAGVVMADAEAQGAVGVMHLLGGVRDEARRAWNASHPDASLAPVALELDLAPAGAALLAAPAPGGRLQRLRARRLREGQVELAPRDLLSAADSRALALGPATPYAWPLRSVGPADLAAYERLLREVLASHIFQPAGHVQQPLQVRLQQMEAEALTLVQLDLQLERRPKQPASQQQQQQEGSGAGKRHRQQQEQQQVAGRVREAGGGGGGLPEPPELMELLTRPRAGPHETWRATLQVKGDAARGLKYVPLRLERVGATQETLVFGGASIMGMLGNASAAADSWGA
eukprot:scaffold6.g2738.t1